MFQTPNSPGWSIQTVRYSSSTPDHKSGLAPSGQKTGFQTPENPQLIRQPPRPALRYDLQRSAAPPFSVDMQGRNQRECFPLLCLKFQVPSLKIRSFLCCAVKIPLHRSYVHPGLFSAEAVRRILSHTATCIRGILASVRSGWVPLCSSTEPRLLSGRRAHDKTGQRLLKRH